MATIRKRDEEEGIAPFSSSSDERQKPCNPWAVSDNGDPPLSTAHRPHRQVLSMLKVTDDPFTHFVQHYIMSRQCGSRQPTYEELTCAWEDLDAQERADFIVKAAKWSDDAVVSSSQQEAGNHRPRVVRPRGLDDSEEEAESAEDAEVADAAVAS